MATPPSTLNPFDAATAVTHLGENRFEADLSEAWWVGRGPNGGYLAACCCGRYRRSCRSARRAR